MGVSVGKYKLLRRLAVGGMAEIFLARIHGEAGFHRKVIIKKILPHYAGEPEFVRRLVDEGLLASRLNHGNIVQVLDLGRLGPDYFIAMEYVDGVDLRDVLSKAYEREFAIPVPIGIHILWQVARALAYAHDKKSARGEALNIIHRDISPANVFISWEGAVKLGDFGIAKASQRLSRHTMTGVLQGKFPYMSPEQTEGITLTQASDIFSFGTLAYELLSQERPFQGDSDMQVLARVKEARFRPIRELRPELPESFAEVVHGCLEKELDRRFPRGLEVERALARVMQENGWVVSEADVADFLGALYGERPAPIEDDLPDEEEGGEIVEASPLDPFDLKAGMPVVPRRAAPPPAQEFTRAVSRSDWRLRQQRRNRTWLGWLLFLLATSLFLSLDYGFFHLLLRPTPAEAPQPMAAAPGSGADLQPEPAPLPVETADVLPAPLPDVRSESPDLPAAAPEVVAAPDIVVPPPDAAVPQAAEVTVAAVTPPPEEVVPAPEEVRESPRPEPRKEAHRASARVTVIPTDARIYANDRLLGEGSQNVIVVEGGRAVDVRIERSGYETARFELGYPPPRTIAKQLQPLALGRLVLRYHPATARVEVDGRHVPAKDGLNIIDLELPAGPHVIVVRDGDRESREEIQIRKDKEWRGTISAAP